MLKVNDSVVDFINHGINAIDGMLNKSAAVIAAVCAQIVKYRGVEFSFIEIGVYKGKFFALIAKATDDNCLLYGVDPFILENQSIDMVYSILHNHIKHNRIKLIKAMSNEHELISRNITCNIMMAHIDGSHKEDDVYNDLKYITELIADDGVIILDDFFHKSHLGVTSATFRFLIENQNIKPFLVSSSKLYLCKQCFHDFYLKKMIEGFHANTHFSICKDWLEKNKTLPPHHTFSYILKNKVIII
mgnify:FL=1